jgi:hypothetical protein
MAGRWSIWASSLFMVGMWYRHPGSGKSRHGMRWVRAPMVPCRPCLISSAPLPPVVAHMEYTLTANYNIEVSVKISGVVVWCNSSVGDAQVTVASWTPSFTWRWLNMARWSPLRSLFWSCCRSMLYIGDYGRMSCLLVDRWGRWSGVIPGRAQCARRSSYYLGLLLMSDGRSRSHE